VLPTLLFYVDDLSIRNLQSSLLEFQFEVLVQALRLTAPKYWLGYLVLHLVWMFMIERASGVQSHAEPGWMSYLSRYDANIAGPPRSYVKEGAVAFLIAIFILLFGQFDVGRVMPYLRM
ncbi:MAG: hypothetical protein RBT63_10030, partial [Bdellovibrionales bacterium]|jgi:hypothetical protein|nr:hypothetical protein [Bdellovibrionales bacterium]